MRSPTKETFTTNYLKLSVVSFAYPYGVLEDPEDDYWGGFVFDCRLMPDPHDDISLRSYSGLDKPIVDFFERHKAQVDRFLDAAEALVRQSIEEYLKNGRDFLQVRDVHFVVVWDSGARVALDQSLGLLLNGLPSKDQLGGLLLFQS